MPIENNQLDLLHSFKYFPGEREIFRMKEVMSPSKWAEKNRIVPIGAHVGPWRNDITPYAAFIMDYAEMSFVREIVIMGTSQSAKTEIFYNYEAKQMEYDPAISIIVMANQETSRKVAEDRIIPMIEKSPRLAALMSDDPDDVAKGRVKLKNGQIIYMAWANSTAALATFPAKRVYLDESAKYPPLAGKETSPVALARKRTKTYPNSYKLWEVSTPVDEYGINESFHEADVIFRCNVKCPDCGTLQLITFDRIQYPEDKTGAEIERDNLARYDCIECNSKWNDSMRDKAVRNGEWTRYKGQDVKRPRKIAFHIPSWLSRDVSLSEVVRAFLQGKTSRAKLIDFFNDYLAEPFIESEEGEGITEDLLYNRREDYSPKGAEWIVPMAASVITCFVDVQGNRLEYEVVAWGEGQESWGLDYRQLPGNPTRPEVWSDLDKHLSRKFRHESGIDLKIAIIGIDSGYLAPNVYKYVKPRQVKRVYATKGSSTIGKPLFNFSNLNLSRSKKKTLKDIQNINLCIIGTETAKDQLYHWMLLDDYGPGYMHYHKGYPHTYFKQLCSEHAVKRKGQARRWVLKIENSRNEGLDLRAGNYAMIEAFNPNFEQLNIEIAQINQSEAPAIKKSNRPVAVQGFKRN